MKTKLFIISLFLILLTANTSASIKLSKDATISILTCSPGNELYSLFGHTGIRVVDKANDMDIVFNYGTFDFATQGFYFKFARGLLPYQLSCSEFRRFLSSYIHDERSVYSQPPPPAAPVWAATWAFWPRASAAFPPQTATLWAAWAM